jgi:hypothetical protein
LTNDATESRTVFVTNAHRDHGKRFVAFADEKLTAFIELESAIRPWDELSCDDNTAINDARFYRTVSDDKIGRGLTAKVLDIR